MAIAIDNIGKSATGSAASSVTITSFAVGAGSDRLLLVGVSFWTGSGTTVSGVTFNTTTSLTRLGGTSQAAFGGNYRADLWYCTAPPNATASIVVSFSGSTDEIVCGASSWTGVDGSTPLGAPVTGSSAAGQPSLTVSSATGEVVHDVATWDRSSGGAGTVGASQTQRWKTQNSVTGTAGAGSSEAGAASVTMTWTLGGNVNWCGVAAAIKPVATGAVTPHLMSIMGCGT